MTSVDLSLVSVSRLKLRDATKYADVQSDASIEKYSEADRSSRCVERTATVCRTAAGIASHTTSITLEIVCSINEVKVWKGWRFAP